MAKFRQVHTSFWNIDTDVEDWTFEQKGFFLYLLTNPHARQCGISELGMKHMKIETGLSEKKILELLSFFQEKGRIIYNFSTKELAVKNWFKYNLAEGAKTMKCIQKEHETVKDKKLIDFLRGISYPISQVNMPLGCPIQVTNKEINKEERGEAHSLPITFEFLRGEVLRYCLQERFSKFEPDTLAVKLSHVIKANGFEKANGQKVKDWSSQIYLLMEKELEFAK